MPTGAAYARLVETLAHSPGVEVPVEHARRRFGSDALRVDGAVFAMLTSGRLVVKLPEERVTALVTSGEGLPFGNGRGRPMREWVSVVAEDDAVWEALAREALAFVGAGATRAERPAT